MTSRWVCWIWMGCLLGLAVPAAAQSFSVGGRVTDEQGRPIAGATILV
ncbi:MAG: carboxypeptidase regulatory-like domain-containing protein, partial [Bacteroidetes bacterium]